eukprot:TRINITY_DN9709_c0_g1_i1.p1 TRINITY_DN9709_c0_g1~~TRINITY_DN9709_c0_g1_i1.p1  ORF type:complete len:408 (-),score=77.94 TRINITY_DN9709_c0_g1_i1:121-1284(-)
MGCGSSASKYKEGEGDTSTQGTIHETKLRHAPPERLAAIRNVFKAIDLNHSGTLDRNEFQAILDKLDDEDRRLTDAQRNELFEYIDEDHSGTIQYSEFAEWVLTQESTSEDKGDTLAQWAARDGVLPVHQAAMSGDEAKVIECLKSGASVNSVDLDDATPLHFACRSGHVIVATILLEAKADFNARTKATSGAPLHAAARCGSLPIIQMLLKAGAGVNMKDKDEITPLHWATMNETCTVQAPHALMQANAEVNARTVLGRTPLHFACRAGNGDVVELLVGAKADVHVHNTEPGQGNTPLHAAARSGSVKATQVLLAAGADVNSRDECAMTPLHWSVATSRINTAALLLEAKADINARTDLRYTPYGMAEEWSHNGMLVLLRKAGGTT